MKITCQSCQAKYSVADEKVQGKTVKIRCKKCGATIIVGEAGAGPNAEAGSLPPPEAGSAGGEVMYQVAITDGEQVSMSAADLIDALRVGRVDAETFVWADGMADWAPIGQVEALRGAMQSPSLAPKLPPPAAARVDTGKKGLDLFAGTVSPPKIAAAAPVVTAASGTSDNSVLFSLAALSAKANSLAPKPAAAMAGRAKDEDSGLIDLNALATADGEPLPSSAGAPDLFGGVPIADPGVFPLGAPPPAAAKVAGAMAGGGGADRKPSTSTALIGGLVALIVVLGGTLVYLLVGRPPPAPPTPVAATVPEVVAQPALPPGVEPLAPEPSAAAESPESAKTVKPKAGGGGRARPAAKPATTPAETKPAAAPAPPAKTSKCGCRPDDLLCNMRCSTK